ncbi:unnamed protein product [Tuwongella immobilis]|uniref:Uncharacterized protein n=1 Tax=Tuwongella immobilis TaxID=692036 RepID=A0A6C2YI82_9BACT|nr:unnamed protein product [Tuwongella immobilis]VTR96968.1 unnamed protein product [Tuwongella immobilis]
MPKTGYWKTSTLGSKAGWKGRSSSYPHRLAPPGVHRSACIPYLSGGNPVPLKPIGSARGTDWEGGGHLPPPRLARR